MTRVGPSTSGIFAFAQGEKAIFDPVISNGTLLFTTYLPPADPCLLGTSFLYGIRYDTCGNGINTDARNSDGTRVPVTQKRVSVGEGLATAPVVNEKTGVGAVISGHSPFVGAALPASRNPNKPIVPMIKLWWREVLF